MIRPFKNRFERGASTLEMTLVGIPIIFVMISIFEISRGMWMYETASHAVREGVRFAIVHGLDCKNDPPSITNSCLTTIGGVATVVRDNAVGLDPTTTQLIFTSPAPNGAQITCTIENCLADSTQWPPALSNAQGVPLRIDIVTPFPSALAMFWPGGSPVAFGVINLGASSSDTIQF